MSRDNKKYISISKTSRMIVLQYISHNKTVVKKYYDKNYIDIEQIKKGINIIHDDNMIYSILPVYINNINNDMGEFNNIGDLVSLDEFAANVTENEIN